MVHVRAEFAFSGTHGRVPAMVGILMAHVGREFAGSRAFLPHVCRREACPVHFCPQFTGFLRTGGRRVPRGRPPALVRPEFRAGVQTRRRRVPARSTASTREGRVRGPPASSRQKCTGAYRQRTHLARVSCGRANSRQECTRGVAPPCGLFLERPVLPQLAFELLEDGNVLLARLADDGKCDRVVICVTH